MGTLTPQSLIHNWWKGGEKQGPYQVVRSGLESLGEEGYSPSFSVGGEPTQLPISWFDPILLMRWTYAQKRVEEAHMILKQGEGPHKSLHFTLQNVLADHKTPHWCEGSDYGVGDRMQYQGFFYTCATAHRSRDSLEMDFPHWALSFKNNSALGHMGGSSYFLGQRGTLSLDHGIARAQTHWLMGQRVLRLSFEAPFHAVAGITCDHEVRLEDPRLPEGAIVGKVIGYTLHLTYGDLVARVDLACGAPENMPRVQKGAYAHQKPQGGILEPESLSAEDLVSTLQVENGLEDQKALLEGQEFESMASLWTLLQAHPTRVSIGFKPLAHGAPLSHTIEVPLQS